MKNAKKSPARLRHQPATPAKTRRRAHVADIIQKERTAGHLAGCDFSNGIGFDPALRKLAAALRIEKGAARAVARAAARRGRIILEPFTGDDEQRGGFTAKKRRRRIRAFLSQEARRRGRFDRRAAHFVQFWEK
jgi:hypothetical protein